MKFLKDKRVIVFLAAAIALWVAYEMRLADPPFIQALRNLTFDSYQRIKPRQPLGQPIRIVEIDEASIAEFGQWPWPRTRIAAIVDRLAQLGVACVAFDMAFSEPDRTGVTGFEQMLDEQNIPGRDVIKQQLSGIPDNDAVLAQSIGKVPTVLGFFNDSLSRQGLPEPKAGFVLLGTDPSPVLQQIEGAVMSLPQLREAAAGLGSISISRSNDDVVRRVPMFLASKTDKYPAFALEALRLVQGATTYVLRTSSASGEIAAGVDAMTAFKVGQFEVPVTKTGDLLLYFARNNPSLYLSAANLFRKPDAELAPLLEGHIVLVGASASGLRDIRVTALGESVPGVFMHAQIIDQILSESYLTRPDWAKGAEIALMILITTLIVAILPFTGAGLSAAFGAVGTAAMLVGSWIAFSRYGLLLDPVFPMVTGAAIFLLTTLLLYAVTEREKRFVRGAFQRYLAPDLLKKLEEHPEMLQLGGEIREMTLMFMDVRGFTPISERLKPEELVKFLNKLLSPLSEAILRKEGAIDKYIGDSIMAFWNAPLDVEDHPIKAARAALEMIEIVGTLNKADHFGFQKPEIGLGDVQIGIGLNTGLGCVGNMGSASRFDYSVVGDTVNVAARIESSCKAIGWPILLSETTATHCAGLAYLEAGEIGLKGKSRPAKLFALVGDEKLAETADWKTLLVRHAQLMKAIRTGRRANFAGLKRDCLAIAPPGLQVFYDQLTDRAGELAAAE